MKMTVNIISRLPRLECVTLIVLGRSAGLALIVILAATSLCLGQPRGTETLRGRVLDPNGAAIAGARINAQNATSFASTICDTFGSFSIDLAPGDYTFTLSADGFAASVRSVTIKRIATAPLEIVLALAGSTATVTVIGADTLGYRAIQLSTATKTTTDLRDLPQSITVLTKDQIRDQSMASIADVVNYVPGITSHQGENNRDQLVIRGNSSSADFFLNGVRDDVQYYRDLYNVERVEALKGPNAMIFGRGGGGGVINRVTKKPASLVSVK
ncbi:MAG: catecholate siderophore receptor [Blastocatellia bacterium]|jgi:catecholate siderophore receptor|nr:catecholate siderophore receptor [Blastocatellia bacterium]